MINPKFAVIENEHDLRAKDIVKALEELLAIARETPQEAMVVFMTGRDTDNTSAGFWGSKIQIVGAIECAKAKVMSV